MNDAYQWDFTRNPVARAEMYDRDKRIAKARKITAVLQDALGDLSALTLLDASCSTGLLTQEVARPFRAAVGIDIDADAVAHARQHAREVAVENCVIDALRTGFAENRFDVIICNQLYEHVPDPHAMMDELYRVLAPGGVCYFGATNRLILIEPHYGRLPLLSWLPRPLADLYLRALGRAPRYYERLLTYPSLRRLVSRFEWEDYTCKVLEDPARFRALDVVAPHSLGRRAALAIARYAYGALPGYIWLLRKPRP